MALTKTKAINDTTLTGLKNLLVQYYTQRYAYKFANPFYLATQRKLKKQLSHVRARMDILATINKRDVQFSIVPNQIGRPTLEIFELKAKL